MIIVILFIILILVNPLSEELESFANIIFRGVTTRNTMKNTRILEEGEKIFGHGENFLVLKGVDNLKSGRNFGVKIL